jgi:coenzyme PQQ precursor peptide PqqA
MCTTTTAGAARSPSAQAGARTDQTRQRPQRWAKPCFTELRLGFEVTLYSDYR